MLELLFYDCFVVFLGLFEREFLIRIIVSFLIEIILVL